MAFYTLVVQVPDELSQDDLIAAVDDLEVDVGDARGRLEVTFCGPGAPVETGVEPAHRAQTRRVERYAVMGWQAFCLCGWEAEKVRAAAQDAQMDGAAHAREQRHPAVPDVVAGERGELYCGGGTSQYGTD